MQNPVGWFEIYVQDMERAKKFYQSVFGTEFTRLNSGDLEMWAFPMNQGGYGSPGALVKMEGVDSKPGGTLNYFMCDDCAMEAKKAADAGGHIHKDKMSIGEYGYIALVLDSEGNLIGLHSMK